MANFKGYNRIADQGLGIGGNPTNNTLINNRLNDNMDAYTPIHEKEGVTIEPPEASQPKKLFKKDFLDIMTDKE